MIELDEHANESTLESSSDDDASEPEMSSDGEEEGEESEEERGEDEDEESVEDEGGTTTEDEGGWSDDLDDTDVGESEEFFQTASTDEEEESESEGDSEEEEEEVSEDGYLPPPPPSSTSGEEDDAEEEASDDGSSSYETFEEENPPPEVVQTPAKNDPKGKAKGEKEPHKEASGAKFSRKPSVHANKLAKNKKLVHPTPGTARCPDSKPKEVATRRGERSSVSTIGNDEERRDSLWYCCRIIPDSWVRFATYVLWLEVADDELPPPRKQR
jgi:hypothetical protein